MRKKSYRKPVLETTPAKSGAARTAPVNDALGHAAGDELLKAVAVRIRREVRESDTVARIGGDEFTVILHEIVRREDGETVARKIITALATPFQLGSQRQSVDIGTSIGIGLSGGCPGCGGARQSGGRCDVQSQAAGQQICFLRGVG